MLLRMYLYFFENRGWDVSEIGPPVGRAGRPQKRHPARKRRIRLGYAGQRRACIAWCAPAVQRSRESGRPASPRSPSSPSSTKTAILRFPKPISTSSPSCAPAGRAAERQQGRHRCPNHPQTHGNYRHLRRSNQQQQTGAWHQHSPEQDRKHWNRPSAMRTQTGDRRREREHLRQPDRLLRPGRPTGEGSRPTWRPRRWIGAGPRELDPFIDASLGAKEGRQSGVKNGPWAD